MLHVALIEPEIPPNTGNIARLCAATGCVLHLVGRLGFRITDRTLKRAGLDYWPHVQLLRHRDAEQFWDEVADQNFYLFSTRGRKAYTHAQFRDQDYLIFGNETAGLPVEILKRYSDRSLYIPMEGPVRSLNLSTAVGVTVFEALRQIQGETWSDR
ncbi:MAG TPA: tRNA (cytidine(34)-2'-O)-methyltransferase [Acidobacteriota bacterium]|jgi:tRNA (cytidine/uridine-2'-O-)-methyltransferase|nr:tRNA (cytidine(34)-2'-O)-methyltransferase [Acidobacteriota bacterium]